MPVRRSDSLRSADSSQRRVSFNRAVHVKRIPRGQAPPAPALAVDQEGRLLPLPVRREKAPRSALELAREARKVLQQADSVSCTASSPSGVPIRPPRTPKTPPPPTSSQEEFRSRTLPYRRAHRGRIVVDLGNSSSTSGGESSLERKGRSKNRQNKQLSPIIETGYNNNSYHHNNNYNPPLNSDTDYLNTQSDSATMLHSRHKSPAPTAIHQTTTIQQTTSSNVTNGPRRSVNVLVRQLQKDSEQSHLNTRVSPQVLHTPDNEICHNNNRPFSYIKPPLDSPAGNEVIYAQVVVSGQGAGVNKQTVHTSVKPPPSDEDEGLEIDAAYRPRHPNGYSVNLRNERNVSSTATSSSRLINEGNSSYDKDVLLDSRLKSSSKFHSGGYNNSSSNYISNNNNLKKKDLCIDSDSSYTKQRDLFDSGIENDNPPLLRHQQHQQQQHESSKIESDGLTAKIVVNGGYNQSRVQQASTNVTRVNLNGRRIHDSTAGATNNVPNGRSSSSNNTTERYYYSGDRRSQSPAMASARLVQQAADRSRDLPASSVLIRHWANSSQDKRSNGSSNTYQRKPRRRLDMEEDTDQDQRAREKQPLVNNKVVVEKEKKKRKMKMKNPFARDKKSPPPIREEQVTTRYSEYKGSNLHLKRTGSDSSRETPASHGPSDTDQGPWDEVDTATDYSRHRILDRSSSNPVHRQQRGPAPRGPSPVVRKSSGESASSLARSEPAINTRASKSSGGAASWFKSLDRLTFRTNKANKAAAAAASADTKKKEEAKNQKNLRFFGDTDQESVISTAHHHASAPAPQRQYRSNQNSRYQTSLAGRSSSSGARRGVQLRQSRQSASPNSSEDSENATTEGDSSLQSQRSVYLHAAAVGDIPGPGGPRRAISREELSSTSGRLQPQTRTLSRSISVLAPWRPRHYRNDAPEIHYDNESTATLRPNSATKPPRAPRSKMSAQSMESLHGSGSSPERARSTSRHRSSKAPAPQPPTSKSSNRMQQQQHHHRSGGTAVSRSASMPKDSRLAGWFRRKKLGSKETNTNNL